MRELAFTSDYSYFTLLLKFLFTKSINLLLVSSNISDSLYFYAFAYLVVEEMLNILACTILDSSLVTFALFSMLRPLSFMSPMYYWYKF